MKPISHAAPATLLIVPLMIFDDPQDSGAAISRAVQDQLGLRLSSTKGPIDVLVIDSVSRPTEN